MLISVRDHHLLLRSLLPIKDNTLVLHLPGMLAASRAVQDPFVHGMITSLCDVN